MTITGNSEFLIQRSLLLLLPHYHYAIGHADLCHRYSCQQSSALSVLSLFESSLQRILIIPIYYILSVLMPYSLLYLPSMTSIRCLLNIFQQKKDTEKWCDFHKSPWHNTDKCRSKQSLVAEIKDRDPNPDSESDYENIGKG
jgi:hypothetical protein